MSWGIASSADAAAPIPSLPPIVFIAARVTDRAPAALASSGCGEGQRMRAARSGQWAPMATRSEERRVGKECRERGEARHRKRKEARTKTRDRRTTKIEYNE